MKTKNELIGLEEINQVENREMNGGFVSPEIACGLYILIDPFQEEMDSFNWKKFVICN